ncbi:helix-turn-helix domain-containing protein [Paenibacillus hamazuiensis]|uniref:helix-turn-helix domain-containing protein n=1 Tax=Paenibacillus hamazuiensis TaxID=2936508 RepID=UPI002010C18D|nr:AraC family transcriptional regulator [Paenibacillus hamazuiensis]
MQMQIKLPQLELYKFEDGYENAPHAHDNEFQITIPIYGTCRFTHEHRTYELAAGESLVQHPADRHSFQIGHSSGVIIFKINERGLLQPDAGAQRRIELDFRQRFDPAEVSQYFRRWTSQLLTHERVDRLAAEETESQVLWYLRRSLRGSQSSELPGDGAVLPDRHLSRALEYIHAHYAEQLSVESLATIALQSRFHFIRSFKNFTGMTPYQYVLRLRVEEAKRRLAHSHESVTEISFGVGFASPSQLYRVFEKTVGQTPEQYRSGRDGADHEKRVKD